MPSQTSSPRAYGLRAHTGRTAYTFAAILASLSVTPAYAVASHDAGAVLSKKVDGEKPGKGIGRDKGGVPVAPVPTVEVTPVPTVAATPVPTVAPKPPPRAQAPKPTPTQAPAPAATPKPKPKPSPTQAAPKPSPTQSAPSPTPAPTRDDRGSEEGRDDRTGVGIPAAPGGGGSGPAIPVVPGATPDSATPTPAGSNRGGGRTTAPRVTGGLVDLADRAAGTGGRAGGGSGGSAATAPVTYRQDPRSGRRVYAVPTPDGRSAREVVVPGGVFGILPSAAVEATAEVRGAMAEGGSRGSVSTDAEAESSGVAQTISRPLEAIDDATGGAIPPALVLAALAAMALVLGFGIRRELHRW